MKKKVILCKISADVGESTLHYSPRTRAVGMFYLRAYCLNNSRIRDAYDICVDYYSINDGSDFISKKLIEQGPDILGLSCYNSDYDASVEVARLVKNASPDMTIVLGGPNMSDPENEMRKLPFADVIIPFEGELAFEEFLLNKANGGGAGDIDGVACREGGSIVFKGFRNDAVDLSSYPEVFTQDFVDSLKGVVIYQTSRGCKFNCSYCLSAGTKYREFPMERVKRELGRLLDSPAVEYISLADLDISANASRMRELLEFVAARNRRNISFFAFISSVGEVFEHIDLMKDAGFLSRNLQEFCVTLQSGSDKVLELANRKWFTMKHLREFAPRILKEFPRAKVELILGLPGETLQTQKRTIYEIFKLGFRQFHLFEYLVNPGSAFYKRRDEFGLKYNDESRYVLRESDCFSREELEAARRFENNFHVLMKLIKPSDIKMIEDMGVDFIVVAEKSSLFDKAMKAGADRRPDMTSIDYMDDVGVDEVDDFIEFIKTEFNIENEKTEVLREYLKVVVLSEKLEARTRRKKERREYVFEKLVDEYVEINVSAGALALLGISGKTPADTAGTTTVYILYNHKSETALPTTGDKEGVYKSLLRQLADGKSFYDVLGGFEEKNAKKAVRMTRQLQDAGFFIKNPIEK